MQKYTKEYWRAWDAAYNRGYADGYALLVPAAPPKWHMFYEAYMGGYNSGTADKEGQE